MSQLTGVTRLALWSGARTIAPWMLMKQKRNDCWPMTLEGAALTLHIGVTEVEWVSTSLVFTSLSTWSHFTWSHNTTHLVKESWQRLYFLRRLRKFSMLSKILSNYYSCTSKSILTNSITVCIGSCTVQDHKPLQDGKHLWNSLTNAGEYLPDQDHQEGPWHHEGQ